MYYYRQSINCFKSYRRVQIEEETFLWNQDKCIIYFELYFPYGHSYKCTMQIYKTIDSRFHSITGL